MVACKGEIIGAGEIALVWSDATLARARRELPGAPKVSFGWREYLGDEADVALGEEGLDYGVAYESYRLASDMTQRWYVAGGRAFLEWDGVPVGAAAQADLFSFFEPWLRLSAVLEHILANHRPGKVLFFDDGSARSSFLAATLATRGVPYESLGGRRGAGLGRRVGWAVRRRLWPAMFLAARRKARRGLPPGRLERRMTRPGAVVFWGQFGRFELDVYEEFRRAYDGDVPYVAATMAAARAAGQAGIICDSLLDRSAPVRSTARLLRRLSADYAALERRGMFEEFGLAPGLAAFFRESFPFRPGAYLSTLASFATVTERFLARWRPALVVHLSDVHMTGRLVASLAARDGIPALVIQNHITGGPTFGYLPLSSTKMAVWGRVSYDWMVEGGAPPEKLAVVGSPYAAAACRPKDSGAGESEHRAVVVATNNYDPDVNRVLALACAAYASERGVPLVFRPHPAESEAPYRAVSRSAGLADAAVVRDAPLSEVLARAAVVVASHSGVGVDAVVAGVPLVHVNLLAGVPDYIPYVEYGAAVGVSDTRDLPAALDGVLASPPGHFDAGREAFARAYLGSDEGDPFANIAALARELEGSR